MKKSDKKLNKEIQQLLKENQHLDLSLEKIQEISFRNELIEHLRKRHEIDFLFAVRYADHVRAQNHEDAHVGLEHVSFDPQDFEKIRLDTTAEWVCKKCDQ